MTDERQIEHLGVRPSWTCTACGNAWPCADAKKRLLEEFHGQRSGLAIYMSAQLNDAFEDLTTRTPYPPPDLYDRFLSWIYLHDTDPSDADDRSKPKPNHRNDPETNDRNDPGDGDSDNSAADAYTGPTVSVSHTDSPVQPPVRGSQPLTELTEPPHQGHRRNGPDAAGTSENSRKSLDL